MDFALHQTDFRLQLRRFQIVTFVEKKGGNYKMNSNVKLDFLKFPNKCVKLFK